MVFGLDDMLAIGSLALSAVGTATSAGAQLQGGAAARQAGNIQAAAAEYSAEQTATIDRYRADLSDYTAAVDEQRAQRYESEAAAQADIISRSTMRALGRVSTAYAAGGVSMTGSSLDVLHDQATEGALQRRLALYGGAVAAADARNQGVLDRAQSNIYRAVATQEQSMGNYRASAALAGGAAVDAASQAGAGATLLTGLGRTASGAYTLFGTNTGGPVVPSPPTYNAFPQATPTQHF